MSGRKKTRPLLDELQRVEIEMEASENRRWAAQIDQAQKAQLKNRRSVKFTMDPEEYATEPPPPMTHTPRAIFSMTHLATQATISQGIGVRKMRVCYTFATHEGALHFCEAHQVNQKLIKPLAVQTTGQHLVNGFSIAFTFPFEEHKIKQALELGKYLRTNKEAIKRNGFYMLPAELSSTGLPEEVEYRWPDNA